MKKALNWSLKHKFEGAAELLAKIVCRSRKEKELEEVKTEEQVTLMLEHVTGRDKAEEKKVLIEVCCGENRKLTSHFKERGGEGIRLFFQSTMYQRTTRLTQRKKPVRFWKTKVSK